MLEEKLRRVKEGVMRSLEQREMVRDKYFQAVHELLVAEGLAKGKYDLGNMDLALETGIRLKQKIGTESYDGIENTYITLKGKPLSPEAQQDVQNLSDLIDNTRKYVSEKAEGKEVTSKKFNEMISSYISSQTEIHISNKYKRAEAIGWVGSSIRRDFKIIPEPLKLGGIDEKELYKAIDKL